MAPASKGVKKKSLTNVSALPHIDPKPKTTRQGKSKNTKLSATSRNGKRKAYGGQGK